MITYKIVKDFEKGEDEYFSGECLTLKSYDEACVKIGGRIYLPGKDYDWYSEEDFNGQGRGFSKEEIEKLIADGNIIEEDKENIENESTKVEKIYQDYLADARKLHAEREQELKRLGVTDLIDGGPHGIYHELNKLNDDFTKGKSALEKKYEQYKGLVKWDYPNILGKRQSVLEKSEGSVVFYLQMKFGRQYYELDGITHRGEIVKELL